KRLDGGTDGLPDETHFAGRIAGCSSANQVLKMLREDACQWCWAVSTRVQRDKIGESTGVDSGPGPSATRKSHSAEGGWRLQHPVEMSWELEARNRRAVVRWNEHSVPPEA